MGVRFFSGIGEVNRVFSFVVVWGPRTSMRCGVYVHYSYIIPHATQAGTYTFRFVAGIVSSSRILFNSLTTRRFGTGSCR